MSKTSIEVATADGTETVKAHVPDGGLAYHKSAYTDCWCVTHVNTGLLVIWGLPRRKDAKAVLFAILRLAKRRGVDLDSIKTQGEFLLNVPKELRDEIRFISRGGWKEFAA